MPKHERFEELCSLAVIGELADTEVAEWTSHLEECAACQASYADMRELASEYLPFAKSNRTSVPPAAVEHLRARALDQVVAHGLRISPEAMRGPATIRRRMQLRMENLRWSLVVHRSELGASAALLILLAICIGALGYEHDRRQQLETLRLQAAHSQKIAAELQQQLTENAEWKNLAVADDKHLEQQLTDASAKLARVEAEKAASEANISSLQGTIERLQDENSSLSQRIDSSDSELASLRGELQQMRADADSKEAELVASRVRVADLSNELKNQQVALDRERELLAAGRDIRDLMGARNLHIIDVHDVGAHGEARPFGRIFLTEGKRLIFYAYDLDPANGKNVAFQAWGHRADDGEKAVSLGILYVDDEKQSRWALKVEDPNLLAAIDSVFVTMEHNGGATSPMGRKLMYAYLRNPINHP